ncbi:MAG: bifunctional nuclease family protein [Prevotellaceae bacterium]|jgi:bifunctional DNase/RNase|nr:bifunctional nuclease family protein [Prevotellaceae bacterium]
MDKEIQVYGYEVTCHEVTMKRFIKLTDKEDKTILNVPMEMFAVRTFFRCLYEANDPKSFPAHKMFIDVIKLFDGKFTKIVIDELHEGVFLATLHLVKKNGREITARAEADDALALAFRAPCDVYIKESVIDTANNDPRHRVKWYDPEDENALSTVRAATHEELRLYPSDELTQLMEIASNIEDYDLAAKLKKALQSKL